SLARALPLLLAEGLMDTKARNAVTALVRVLKRENVPGGVELLRALVWLKERLPPARPTRGRKYLAIRGKDRPRVDMLLLRIARLQGLMPAGQKAGQPQEYVQFACKVAITHMQFLERLGIPTPLWPTLTSPSIRFAVNAVAAVYGGVYDAAADAGPEAI